MINVTVGMGCYITGGNKQSDSFYVKHHTVDSYMLFLNIVHFQTRMVAEILQVESPPHVLTLMLILVL